MINFANDNLRGSFTLVKMHSKVCIMGISCPLSYPSTMDTIFTRKVYQWYVCKFLEETKHKTRNKELTTDSTFFFRCFGLEIGAFKH